MTVFSPSHTQTQSNVDLMEEMASPSLLERSPHPAVTLDPDSLKLRISLTPSTLPTEQIEQIDQIEDEEGIPWDESLYESLRLCRKRAYCKVQSKRRLHLPASLAVFLHREWNATHPQFKIKPRDLLDIYENRFEGGSKRRKPYVRKPKKALTPSPLKKSSSSVWTPSTLMHLGLIGQKVEKMRAANPQMDYSSRLQEEWLKYYPESPLTGRNLKARLFLYNKTRPEHASHAKKPDAWSKEATDLIVKIYKQLDLSDKSYSKLAEALYQRWEKEYTGSLILAPSDLVFKIENLLEKEPELFSKSDILGRNDRGEEEKMVVDTPEESQTEDSPSWSYRVPLPPKSEWACSKHWVHIFEQGLQELDCSLTEDLVNIRNSCKNLYPNSDIFEKPYLKQPRKAGLVGAITSAWRKLHPEIEDSVKSIILRLYKYDQIPDVSYFMSIDNRAKLRYYLNVDEAHAASVNSTTKDSEEWTEEMITQLKATREFAETKAEENANGTPSLQAVTRIWKNRWRSLYPDLQLDWKLIVDKYNSLDNSPVNAPLLSSSDDMCNVLKSSKIKNDPDALVSSDDSEVKGFRQWNANMKQGLVNTKESIIKSLYPQTIDLESKQFANLLFNEFRKLFPKCMESTRSLLSKLQSIEKEGFMPLQKTSEDTSLVANGFSSHDFSDDNDALTNSENISPKLDSSVCSDFKDEIMPPIIGFPDWSITMIRDFIACMDVARKKYSAPKSDSCVDKQNQPRLIPLLLNEWKEIYPDSTETDKTFLEKIKHLKTQKETIKTYLGASGLLAKRDHSVTVVEEKPEEKPSEEDKICWDKSMMEDVVRTRDIALKRLGETHTKGKKMSFHHTWWEEFRKIYPNCNFGKNTLSAHYWGWKKRQNTHESDPTTLQKPEQQKPQSKYCYQAKRSYSNWSKEDKDQLLDLAFKLQKETDHEALKYKGFGAVLRDQWKVLRPDRIDHPSTLNLLYAKYLKEIKAHSATNSEPCSKSKDGKLKVPKWTPRHNRTLRQCLTNCQINRDEEGFAESIIDSWRKLISGSTLTDIELKDRLQDLMEPSKTSWNLTPEAKKHLNFIFARIFCQTLKRNHMRHDLVILPEKKAELASNLHRVFVRKFPDCPLGPEELLHESDMFRSKSASVDDNDASQTWTPLMIKNMIEMRKMTLMEKKTSVSLEVFNFGEVWYKKFVDLHPEYLSTKRNLLRKYRWYRNQISDQREVIHSDNKSSFLEEDLIAEEASCMSSATIQFDFLQHIRTLCETSEIALPSKLPSKEEYFKQRTDSAMEGSKNNSSLEEKNNCFHFPGGAKLFPLRQVSSETKEDEPLSSNEEEMSSDSVHLLVLDIPPVVENRLQALDLSSKDFHDLLIIYATAREEYVSFLKKGYFVFFPFILQVAWLRHKKDIINPNASGRNLVGLIEMFLEILSTSRGKPLPTEFISNIPRKLNVNELTLRQIMDCFLEDASASYMEYSKDVQAFETWKKRYPEMCFSFKELISLHRMMTFEDSPEVSLIENLILDCAIADISSHLVKSEELYSSSSGKQSMSSNDYDKNNISIEQLTEWYYKTKLIPSSMGLYPPFSVRPHYGVKNIKLFWSNDRMQDLELCYQKASYKFKKLISNPRLRIGASFVSLMSCEWKKMYPGHMIDSKIIVGKYVSHRRRRMSERSQKENLRIHEWTLDVLDFIDSKNTTTLESSVEVEEELQEPQLTEEQLLLEKDESEDDKEVVVSVEEVLQKIDERGKRSAVWTSSVMRDLLKAREESKRRKKEIERDPKIQKVDNVFVEEWRKIRPKMGHMSIWTLNAYVRKFDQFRNKLLQTKLSNSKPRVTPKKVEKRALYRVKYLSGSSIPLYDLLVLNNLKEVSQEVKDLLTSRQRAMEAKMQGSSKYTLDYLWPLEWKKINGGEMRASQLRNKLWSVERFPSNMERLKVALLKDSPSSRSNNPGSVSYMPILPRRYMFPEEQILRTPFRFSQKVSFYDNSPHGISRKRKINTSISLSSESPGCKDSGLDIPTAIFERQILTIENEQSEEVCKVDNELYWDKFQPKRTKLESPIVKISPAFSSDNSGFFVCDECDERFRNINNYEYHVRMH